MLNLKILIIVLIGQFALVPSVSYAYIDPASGSALVSVLVALIAALFLSIKGLYYNITSVLFMPFNIKVEANNPKLVFYSEGAHYWSTFKPVLEALDEKGIEAIYLTSSGNDEGLNFKSNYITSKYIGNGMKAYNFLNRLEADVCAMTTPGLDVLHIRRSKGVKHYCYLPHSPIDLGKYKLYSFDGFDSIFLTGAYQEKSLRALEELRSSHKKKIFYAGCPYMDEMGARLSQVKKNMIPKDNRLKTILLAPTWGKNNILRILSVEQIKKIVSDNYELIIRPHPQSYIAEPELIQNLKDEFEDFSSIKWDDTKDSFESLLRSDLLISSLSGIIFDYAFIFEKRSIIIEFDYDFTGQEANDLPFAIWDIGMIDKVGLRLSVDEIDLITDKISALLNDEDSDNGLTKLRVQNLFNYGKSGKFIANALCEIAEVSKLK